MVELSKNPTFVFVTTREGSAFVNYTPDYISKLAREGKVVAKRAGRSWLVDRDSLKLFALEQEAEARRRQEELKEQRRHEKILQRYENKLEVRRPVESRLVVIEAAAITICMMVVLLLGSVIYSEDIGGEELLAGVALSSEGVQEAVAFKSLEGWQDWLWLFKSDTTVERELVERPQSAPVAVPREYQRVPHITQVGEVVLLPASLQETAGNVFSDEVHVQFVDGRRGTITPAFMAGQFEEYPFRVEDKQYQN